MKKLFALFSLFVILSGFAPPQAQAQLDGITIAHHDIYNREDVFNKNPRQFLKDFKTAFKRVRFMDEPGMPDAQTVGLNADIKQTISYMKMADDLGYKEVMLALFWQKAGCINGTPFYYSSTDVANNIGLIVKAMKGRASFIIQLNDLDLAHKLSASPSYDQARDPVWIAAHLSGPTWVNLDDTAALVRTAKQIMAVAWKINPKQRFAWQITNVPLDVPSPLVETAINGYVPAAMQDVQGLKWPMSDSERDQVLSSKGYVVPPWQKVSYSTEGLYAYFKANPCDVVPEAGLPPSTPYATRLAWLRSASAAMLRAKMRGYNFFWEEIYGPDGKANLKVLREIADAIAPPTAKARLTLSSNPIVEPRRVQQPRRGSPSKAVFKLAS